MSKFNPNHPRFHIGEERVTLREFIAHNDGEDVGEAVENAAERGVYRLGPLASYLAVGPETYWPRGLDLDSVFPLDKSELPKDQFREGGISRYMQASKPVQDDMKAINAAIAKQYGELLGAYFTNGKPKPGAITDLRAFRKETRRIGRRYAGRAGMKLDQIRKRVAVLFLEARRVIDPSPHTVRLSSDAIDGLKEARSRFVDYFWGSAVQGGPRLVNDAGDLARWLHTEGASEELLRFQSESLYALLEERDGIITEALPVEFRRMAGEMILWKVAHGQPVEPWSVEDEAAVKEDLKRGAGNPNWIDEALSHEEVKAIYDLADKLLKEDPDKYRPKRAGTIVSTELRDEIALQLGVAESTARRYLIDHLERWS